MKSSAKQDWYGGTASTIARNKDYITQKYDCSGKGIITIYQVFDGVQIIFMEFESTDTFFAEFPHEDIIEISWCRKGRVECEFANQIYSHLAEGDFWIDADQYIPMSYSFPFGIFEAISLVIDKHLLTEQSKKIISSFSIDIDRLGDVLALDKRWYICRSDKYLKHLFDEIYTAKGVESSYYFSIKALELLYHTEQLTQYNGCEIQYYSREQIQAVKRIWTRLITNLDEKISLEELARTEQISMTMVRTIFGQMYGDSPYAYLKKYKMGVATKMLLDKKMKIGEIALSLGYCNASKFSAAFQDIYHMIPKDYRKTYC